MKNWLLLLVAGSWIFTTTQAQPDTVELTLQEVVRMAREKSIAAMTAENELQTAYWEYRLFKANYRPTLSLDGTLPSLNRSIQPITQPDGSDAFVNRSLASSSAGVSLMQRLQWTGGQVFIGSDLERIDLFSDPASTSYLVNPITIGIRQPLFQFNPYKWENDLAPLQYEEAKKRYLENLEQVSINAVQQFFDLYLANINVEIARQNVDNTDTLMNVTRGRYNLGKIGENDLLQMELQLYNARSALAQARLDVRITSFRLKRYLRLSENVELRIIPPTETPQVEVDLQVALDQARMNRSEQVGFERQRMEAQMNLERAKKETDFNADITASFGLTNSAPAFEELYGESIDYERFALSFSMPILDWGKSKAQVSIAQSNNELVRNSIEEQSNNFDQQVMLQVSEFDLQQDNLIIAAKADTIANKRYEVARQRYIAGKVSITDLNLANTERDVARRDYLSTLRNYWINYYNIRKITLYDFARGQPIDLPAMNY
jgi:outer membrane protein TolC